MNLKIIRKHIREWSRLVMLISVSLIIYLSIFSIGNTSLFADFFKELLDSRFGFVVYIIIASPFVYLFSGGKFSKILNEQDDVENEEREETKEETEAEKQKNIDNRLYKALRTHNKYMVIDHCMNLKEMSRYDATKHVKKLNFIRRLKQALILIVIFFPFYGGEIRQLLFPTPETITIISKADSLRSRNQDIEIKKLLDSIEVVEIEKIKKEHPEWSKETCQKLAYNIPWIGMSYEMLVYLKGNPNSLKTSADRNGYPTEACWDHDNNCFYYDYYDRIIYKIE